MRTKARFLSAFLAAVMILALAIGGAGSMLAAGSDINIEDLSGTFVMWNWDIPNNTNINAAFNKLWPNIQCDMLSLQPAELLEKYQMAMASGTEVGDVIWAERSTHAAMLRIGGFEKLDQAPYNVDRSMWLDSVIPYVVDEDDNVIGFDISVCPAGFVYSLDLAMQYFGTSDPKELEAMFPTWDSMIEMAQEIYEKSDGKHYLFANRDSLLQPMIGQRKEYTVVDGKLNLENTVFPALEKVVRAKDNHAFGPYDSWTPEFFSSLNEDSYVFHYSASWYVGVVIQPNATEMQGKYGIMRTPEGDTSWGGTTMMIPSAAENKELAFAYLSLLYGTKEGAQIIKDVSVQLVGLKEAFADPAFTTDINPWFPNQDLGAVMYGEIAPNMTGLFPDLHNQIINNTVGAVFAEVINYDLTFEEAQDRVYEIIAENNFDFLS